MLGNFIRVTLLVLSHSIALYVISVPKESLRRPLLFWTLITVFAELVLAIMLVPQGYVLNMAVLAYLFIYVLYVSAFAYASFWPVKCSVFIFSLYAAYFMLSYMIADFLGKVFFDNDTVMISWIRTAFSLALIIIYPFTIKKPLVKMAEGAFTGWGPLIFFGVVACIFVSVISFAGSFLVSNTGLYSAMILFMSLFLISAFVIVIKIVGLMNEMSSRKAMEMQNAILSSELESEKALVDSARTFRHDLKRHCVVVSSYIEEGRSEEALDYLETLVGSIEKSSPRRFTGNAVVNALLMMTARRIAAIDGEFSFDVVLPEDLDIPRTDLAVVFGNLLENAYEAAEKTSHPSLSVYARIIGNALHGEIVNTMEGNPVMEGRLPRSTKQGGGMGLRNVFSVLDSYGGMLDLKAEDGRFTARFIIPLSDTSGN